MNFNKKTYWVLVVTFLTGVFLISLNLQASQKKIINEKINVENCKNLNFENSEFLHPSNFSSFKMELKFNSLKDWRRKNLRVLLKSEENKKKSGNFRRFRTDKRITESAGEIIIKYKENEFCFLKAKIRVHGDLEDHVNTTLPSIKVKLSNGHIFGITEFILFSPKTRKFDNEILAATLFKSLGFIAPRTSNIELSFYGKKLNYIFQEIINKEFLENNNLREFPIYKGDERFTFFDFDKNNIHFSHYKLENRAFIKDHNPKLSIAQYGLSILNKLNYYDKGEFFPDYIDQAFNSKKLFNQNYFKNYEEFAALMIALNSNHNLSRDDLRLYFNREINKFFPIYYDGSINLHYQNTFLNEKCPKKVNCKIIKSAINGADKATDLLKNLNLEEFKKKLFRYNLNKERLKIFNNEVRIEDVDQIINKLLLNLNEIKNTEFEKKSRIVKSEISKEIETQLLIDENKQIIDNEKRKLIFFSKNFNKYLRCDIFFENCKSLNTSFKDIKKYLSQNYFSKDKNNEKINYVFTSRTNSFNNPEWYHENFNKNFGNLKSYKVEKFNFYGLGEINYNFDKNLNILQINLINKDSKIIFRSQNLDNLKIKIASLNTEVLKRTPGMDEFGFTGCLNIYDSKIRNLEISSVNAQCEDAVNFVRVDGSINKLEINNALFDGLDSDFSNILFEKVTVNNSGNDCLDFSFGNYEIQNSELKTCGDKAISVGELSEVLVDETNINKAESGIVSKDFAKTRVLNTNIKNTDVCFQAYNKKQEFAGGYLEIKNINCDQTNRKRFNKDKVSEIILK